MYFNIIDFLSFSFLFLLLQCPWIVPLLQTCSTYMFAYDHVCFCAYIYLLDLCSTYERKHVAFVFLNMAYIT
jgi:hypothetical protein